MHKLIEREFIFKQIQMSGNIEVKIKENTKTVIVLSGNIPDNLL